MAADPNLTANIPPVSASITADSDAMTVDGYEEDKILSNSKFLSREEVLRRRSRRVKQLAKVYRDHYWSLMEELRVKYRDYYWKYGKSPYKEDLDNAAAAAEMNSVGDCMNGTEESGDNTINVGNGNANGKANGVGLGLGLCAVGGCKAKAMALSKFCHPHILSDPEQKLYKPCDYVIKSAHSGPVTCAKPILRSTVPSLCSVHFQKAEKHLSRALKKAGLNVPSTSKLAPKLHVMVAEFVRQIQTKRRSTKKEPVEEVQIKEEKTS